MKTVRSGSDIIARIEAVLAQKPAVGVSPLDEVAAILLQGRNYVWVSIYLVLGHDLACAAAQGPEPGRHKLAFGGPNAPLERELFLSAGSVPGYSMRFAHSKAEAVVPMKIAGRVLGVMDVETERSEGFSPQERILLKDVAGALALYMTGKGKHLVRKTREQVSHLRAISESGKEAKASSRAAGEKK